MHQVIIIYDSPLPKFINNTYSMNWTERGWQLLKSKDIQQVSQDNDRIGAHFITFINQMEEKNFQ